ncbi:heat shock protein transcriptional repressor HspR [Georgenia sp. Z1491]|uniref:heat shock protein transcriptional repressor HspR n=1 Tax=Georgenia sp. Z1491 TaxID=3416707 RepID=UPI003CF8A274
MSPGRAGRGRARGRVRAEDQIGPDTAVLTISVAAELAGMHPQTLRQYDRLGLVAPHRTAGRGRRYSLRDVSRLREVQRLSQEKGVNLAGIEQVLRLRDELDRVTAELEALRARVEPGSRVFTASSTGVVVAGPRGRRVRGERRETGALVLWQGHRRTR